MASKNDLILSYFHVYDDVDDDDDDDQSEMSRPDAVVGEQEESQPNVCFILLYFYSLSQF